MQTKYKILIAAIALLVSFATGRFTAPAKIQVVTKTVTSDNQTDSTKADTDKHQVVEKKEIDHPDGTKEVVTVLINDAHNHFDTTNVVDKSTETDQTKTITKDTKRLNISALAGVDPFSPAGVVYGAHVSTGALGPITVGLFGMTDGVVGCSVGLSF